ncbi:hypothetical protein J19TS1_36520 [Heyndrickxia oleronia]|nr:hypothetical protein J19TS1_36520 [Heyndrickxia oleronia]
MICVLALDISDNPKAKIKIHARARITSFFIIESPPYIDKYNEKIEGKSSVFRKFDKVGENTKKVNIVVC